VFDPFEDFDTAGHLRNVERIKDLELVKVQEHVFFEANLEEALTFLRKIKGPIAYKHFLSVHQILFGDFYQADDQQAIASYLHVKRSRGEPVEDDLVKPQRPAGRSKP